MKTTHKIIYSMLMLAVAGMLFYGCRKDDDETIPAGTGSFSGKALAGIVVDELNAPVSGAVVKCNSQTVTTDMYGTFVIQNVLPKARIVITAAKAGYLKGVAAVTTSANTVTNVRIMLLAPANQFTFGASSAYTAVVTGGAQVVFPANGYVTSNGSTYNGMVTALVKHLSPGDADFGFKIPGRDLLGVSLANEPAALYSFGMLGVELTGSTGEPLQLKTGTSAQLTMPVDAAQQAAAPSIIPMWHFDEGDGKWHEEGQAVKTGSTYTATVSHFSWWNCDVPYLTATLTGKVVDCNGTPMPNVIVTFQIFNLVLYTSYASTDNNGFYSIIVPANYSITVQVEATMNGNLFQSSGVITVPPISANQTVVSPVISVNCIGRVQGTISGCNGSNTNAFVHYSFQGFTHSFYSTTGSFNIPVPENILLSITLYNAYGVTSASVISGAIGSVTNIGNFEICSTSGTQPENSFYISGNGYNNYFIAIDTAYTYFDSWSGAFWEVNASGMDNATGLSVTFSFKITDSVPGIYVCDDASSNYALIIDSTGANHYCSNVTGGNIVVNLQQVDVGIGGRVKGSFYGTLGSCDTTIIGSTVTISNGQFNVVRVN